MANGRELQSSFSQLLSNTRSSTIRSGDDPVCKKGDSTSNPLPGQDEFLTHEKVISSHETALPPDGTRCVICLDECDIPSTHSHSPYDNKPVVYLEPCGHFFHDECILTWFTGTRPERDTCPNCRRVLFTPTPLTPAQIASLDISDPVPILPLAPFRRPGPNEEVVLWEQYVLDRLAHITVEHELERQRNTGRPPRWIFLCGEMRDHFLLEGESELRPAFQPHVETFVSLACLAPLLFWLAGHYEVMESLAYYDLLAWAHSLVDQLEQQFMRELRSEYSMHGLFNSLTTRVEVVPRSWTLDIQRAAERNAVVQRNMERRLTMRLEAIATRPRNAGFRGLLKRIARRVILPVLPGRAIRRTTEEDEG